MERIHEILIRKNLPHVATLQNSKGEFEPLFEDGQLNYTELLQGMAELNRNGIVLFDIRAGVSREGITKIADVSHAGLFLNNEWILKPTLDDENQLIDLIPFKTDSWLLGELIVEQITGKKIPKRFLKSQTLLDKFIDSIIEAPPFMNKLLVLDPEKREYTWNLAPPSSQKSEGCNIM
jgi:hypothetical protein